MFKQLCLFIFTVEILSAFRSLFRHDFHWSETDCIIGIKVPFSDRRLKSSNSTNVDCIVTCVNLKFTREIRNRWRLLVSVGLAWQGIFLNFQKHFLCIYSTLVQEIKLFFTVLQQKIASSCGKVLEVKILLSKHKSNQVQQAASSLPLAREQSSDVNNKPISIPYLKQGYRWNVTRFNLKVEFWFQ